MKLYLAGPMRGYDYFNFPAFLAAAAALEFRGHEVHCPATHDLQTAFDPALSLEENAEKHDFSLPEAFAWDIRSVLYSEGIVMLPGWRSSEGATTEYEVARLAGKQLFDYCGFGELGNVASA